MRSNEYVHDNCKPVIQVRSNPSLLNLSNKVTLIEGAIGVTKHGLVEGILGGFGHDVPVKERVLLALAGLELEFVVRDAVGEVLGHDTIAVPLWAGVLLVAAVGRCRSADHRRSVVGRVINVDDDVLPVVAVAVGDVAIVGLVLGEVPGVHNGEAAVVPCSSGVRLSLGLISAAASGGASVLKTTAVLCINRLVKSSKSGDGYAPSVAGLVDSRIRLAAVGNVEERREPLDAITLGASPDGFSQGAERVVGNLSTGCQERGTCNARGSSKSRNDCVEEHFGGWIV